MRSALVLVFALVSATVSAAPMASTTLAASAVFTFKDLVSLIQTRDVRSVEDAIPLLPASMRSNIALVYRSRSIQGGSPENPRAILFTDDGSTVVSFNGLESQRGGDHIEIVSFDPAAARFQFSTIAFSAGAKAQVVENAQNCLGCHGRNDADLHPVWDPGLVWRGAYGSQNDAFSDPAVQDEGRAYAAFVAGASKLPRYRSLDFINIIGASPRIENRPNLRLGLIRMRQGVKRIARQIFEISNEAKIRDGIKMMLECKAVPPNPQVRTRIEAGLSRYLDAVFSPVAAAGLRAAEGPSLILAQDVGHWLGADLIEWPLTAERGTFATFDSSFLFRDLLVAALFERLKPTVDAPRVSLTQSPLGLPSSPALDAIDRLGNPLEASSTDLCAKL